MEMGRKAVSCGNSKGKVRGKGGISCVDDQDVEGAGARQAWDLGVFEAAAVSRPARAVLRRNMPHRMSSSRTIQADASPPSPPPPPPKPEGMTLRVGVNSACQDIHKLSESVQCDGGPDTSGLGAEKPSVTQSGLPSGAGARAEPVDRETG